MLSEDGKKIEETLKLSDDSKKVIDSLTKEELIQEINKKNRSQFQGDKYAYLKTRLEVIEHQELQQQRQEDVAHKTKELTLAREANALSHSSNKLSKVAIAISIVAVLVALGALVLNITTNGNLNAP